jgi:hypothetical protein
MHELTGIPENALGQTQAVSNTSGVALSILFQPLMNKYKQKVIQYAHGLERVNELILITLAIKEPEALLWNPSVDVPLKNGQVPQLDPNDPLTYQTYTHFPPPLPLDKLIILNEIQTKMSLGLESKSGAMRALGENFPDEKLEEIRQELLADARADGALKLVQTQIENEIMSLTGMMSGGVDGQPVPMGGPEGSAPGAPQPGAAPAMPIMDEAQVEVQMGEQSLRTELVTEAYGTMIPQRRVPSNYNKD